MQARVLLVDDEAIARQRLQKIIAGLDGYICCGEAANGEQAIELCKELNPDILLLDISMPGISGLETAAQINLMENPPAIIFCTAYDQYLLDAFAAQAIGYLIKPVRPEQLEDSLANSRRINRMQMAELKRLEGEGGDDRRICVSSTRGTELIDPQRITLCEADQKYIRIHYNGREILTESSLKKLEQEYPQTFVRVHRNALVGLQHIEGLERSPDGETRVRITGLEQKPLVSRRHLKEVKERVATL